MKFLLNFLLVLKCISFNDVTLFEVNLDDLIINIHQNQAKNLDLNQARSAILLSKNSSFGCEIIPLHLKLETQELRIVQNFNFLESDINQEINFRQFISMTHIIDGMLAITSDLIVYLLKFNYNFLSKHDFKEIGQQFAKVVWKFNLTQLTTQIQFKQEFPKLLFAPTSNVAFILQNDRAQLFSLAQIETQGSSLNVYEVPAWIQRSFRGFTKEMDGLIFSAVGTDGLDIYLIVEKGLKFIVNIKDFHECESINIIDFSIINKGTINGLYVLFILDKQNGIFLAEIEWNLKTIKYNFKFWLEQVTDGISVDTKNGKNVFFGYQQQQKYYLVEYFINILNGYNFVIRRRQIGSRIIDVDASDEFVIVQGVNQHTIVFCNDYDYLIDNEQDQIFRHVGLRDFEFFNQAYKLEGLSDINREFEKGDFFFGITSQTAFLTRFQVQPIQIHCLYHQQNSNIGDQFLYQLSYNMTHKNLTGFVVKYTQDVKVNIIETYLYENDLEILKLCLFVFIVIFLMILVMTVMYLDKKNNIIYKQRIELENLKMDQKYKQDNLPQTGKIDETSALQIQNQSIIQQ